MLGAPWDAAELRVCGWDGWEQDTGPIPAPSAQLAAPAKPEEPLPITAGQAREGGSK